MVEHWVLNASPLIVLARVGLEDLPLSLATQVVVPRPVAEEIQGSPSLDPARQALASGRFIIVDTPPPPPELLAWDLGMARPQSFRGLLLKTDGRPFWMMLRPASVPRLFLFRSRER